MATPSSSAARSSPLISIAQAAERLDLSKNTIRKYIADGKLPAYRVGQKLIKLDPADLDRFAKPIGLA